MGNDAAPDQSGSYPIRVGFTDDAGEEQFLSIDLIESTRIALRFPDGTVMSFSWQQALRLNSGISQSLSVLLSRVMDEG